MNSKNIIDLYIIGVSVLVGAIFINALAGYFRIMTWYQFLNDIASKGVDYLKNVGLINYLFLFLVYPLLLGIFALLGIKFSGWIK